MHTNIRVHLFVITFKVGRRTFIANTTYLTYSGGGSSINIKVGKLYKELRGTLFLRRLVEDAKDAQRLRMRGAYCKVHIHRYRLACICTSLFVD